MGRGKARGTGKSSGIILGVWVGVEAAIGGRDRSG